MQAKGFSPVWESLWYTRPFNCLQEKLHWSQAKGFSPECCRMCIFVYLEMVLPWMCWYVLFEVIPLCEGRGTLVATEWFFTWMYEHVLLEGTCRCAGKVALFVIFWCRTLTRSAGILAFYGNLWHFGIFAKKSDRKSDPIFPILSDFFRFFDFSRLPDFPIPQL